MGGGVGNRAERAALYCEWAAGNLRDPDGHAALATGLRYVAEVIRAEAQEAAVIASQNDRMAAKLARIRKGEE